MRKLLLFPLSLLALCFARPAAAQLACTTHTFAHITSGTDTLVITGAGTQTVRICGVVASFAGSAAQSIYLEDNGSANPNCSSTKTQISGLWTGSSSTPTQISFYAPVWAGLANFAGDGLCIHSSGTGGVDVDIWYASN